MPGNFCKFTKSFLYCNHHLAHMNTSPCHSITPLNLPPLDVSRLRRNGDVVEIFDPLRGKHVALTPEEWVRQHFVGYMMSAKGFPAALIANEIGLTLNGTRRRCDTVVFDRSGKPMMIVEYKAPGVAVTQKVFDQIVRYNMVLRARYLTVSNGLSHYCCRIDYATHSYAFLPELPDFSTCCGDNQNR